MRIEFNHLHLVCWTSRYSHASSPASLSTGALMAPGNKRVSGKLLRWGRNLSLPQHTSFTFHLKKKIEEKNPLPNSFLKVILSKCVSNDN